MIGIFGGMTSDPDAPFSVSGMAEQLDGRVDKQIFELPGAAIGHAFHPRGAGGGGATSPCGRFSLVYGGEIFDGGDRTQIADALLATLIRKDLVGLARINGQFCAAMYDRDDRRLTFITDRLCTFPIHIWKSDDRILFASQIYILLGNPGVSRDPEPAALAQLFTMQRTIGRVTPFKSIEALPAASCITAAPGHYEEQSYWTLEWRRPDFDRKEGVHLLANAMRNSVERQCAGDRTGLMFSGGLDSRMILAAAPAGSLPCWTTASYADNPELHIAKALSASMDAKHHSAIVPPEATFEFTEAATIAADGMYPSSNGYYALAEQAAPDCAVALTGHGLDYTLRGYYLPAKFLSLAGSKTRFPGLRGISAHPTGKDVLENLRQGPPLSTIARIVDPRFTAEWWRGQAEAMETVLSPWLQSDEPYNAWDAFLLHAISKHYAFTGMQAIRQFMDLRMPAFDTEVLDIYLRMPPAWRCHGRMAQKALVELNPVAARMPNANTHFRCDLHPYLEFGLLLARGALRRLGVMGRTALPSSAHSEGSWQNLGALYRELPAFRQRLAEIRNRLDALAFHCLDADGLAKCIDEHLAGDAKHDKLLRQLLTHDAWARTYEVI